MKTLNERTCQEAPSPLPKEGSDAESNYKEDFHDNFREAGFGLWGLGLRVCGTLKGCAGIMQDYGGGPCWGLKIFRTASGRPACFYVVTRR